MIFIIVINELRVTIALTCFMYVSYVVGHERALGLVFQCIVSILRVLTVV
jgi:hypothetical protein